MLETTLKTQFIPGTNLSGGLARADWRFLLPQLRYDTFVCLGVPTAASLPALASLGRVVLVVSPNHRVLSTLQRESQKLNLKNVKIVVANFKALPFQNGRVDLMYHIKEKREGDTWKIIFPEMARVLKTDGVIYFESRGFRPFFRRATMNGFTAAPPFWLTPFSGRMRTALPFGDRDLASYFFTNVMFGKSFKKRLASSIGKSLSRMGLTDYLAPRRAGLMQHAQNGRGAEPFDYLIAMAEKAGLNVQGCRIGISMRGPGNSNKVIFYLFEQNRRQPRAVVKMTRDPEFNHRLENEYRMLSWLKEKRFVRADSFPEPLFFDYHNELAVLGLSAVEGEPFRARTSAKPDCPLARDAINWLVELGTRSVDKTSVSSKNVVSGLFYLFDSFNRLYQLSEPHQAFLAEQIRIISERSHEFPVVVQHGDPGTWNMLATKQDRVIVIDWEAGEPQGMPLWDLFYFLRTFASWIARQQGRRDSFKNFYESFLKSSPLRVLLHDSIARYCDQVGVAAELVRPLFYTSWMHRALKEATRLTTDQLEGGHYVNLLRLTIDQKSSVMMSKRGANFVY